MNIMRECAAYCEAQGLRLTPPRQYVLEIIAKSKTPLTAYEVLEALGKKIKSPKPPTAYRALEFLVEHRFIHRIESLNAYVACRENHKHGGSQFMICEGCGHVAEVHLCHMPEPMTQALKTSGFQLTFWNAEFHGMCAACSV